MEEKENYFTATKEALQDYLEERMLLVKLQSINYGSKAAGSITVLIIASLLGIAFLVLLGITGGLLFAGLTGSYAGGFAIITGIYLLLIILVVVSFKKAIQNMVISKMIRGFFNKENINTQNNGQPTHH